MDFDDLWFPMLIVILAVILGTAVDKITGLSETLADLFPRKQ